MGLVVDLDLLLADVLLDYLDVFDDLLADADLLLHHGPFFDHELFLDHRNDDLFFPDLRRGGDLFSGGVAFFDGYTLDGYLGALFGHLEALPLGAHELANTHRPGFALAPSDQDLFLRAPHPDLVILAARHARRRLSTSCPRPLHQAHVGGPAFGGPGFDAACDRQGVVEPDPPLDLGGDLFVVAQARRGLHHGHRARDHHPPELGVDLDDLVG